MSEDFNVPVDVFMESEELAKKYKQLYIETKVKEILSEMELEWDEKLECVRATWLKDDLLAKLVHDVDTDSVVEVYQKLKEQVFDEYQRKQAEKEEE